ncbi:hypothetical protein DFJ74DRAFT_647856 [Hyaloraphidium curvatum]|nr:hypothetical protein DFJ74DRAFT_647856 [Hyaloraphidium curvatum]
MKAFTMRAHAAAALALAIVLAALPRTAAQDLSPNSPFTWVSGPKCSPGGWGGGCCCTRPATVRMTKYKTKTAVKTVKRTRTTTRTLTVTSLVRLRMEARQFEEQPIEPVVANQEILDAPTEDPVPLTTAEDEPAVGPLEFDILPGTPAGPPDDQSPADTFGSHNLFARDYCRACPRGVVPRPSARGRTERCCVTKVTKYTTKTKTKTRTRTTTVKTSTKTVTKTVTQSARVRLPVLVQTDSGTPVPGAIAQLIGPPLPTRRLVERQEVILATCTTLPDGRCTLLVPTSLAPGTTYRIVVVNRPGTTVFLTTDASGNPPAPTGPGGTYPVVVNEVSTLRLGRRELVARRDADGKFRRAIKALATPSPEIF